MKEREYYKYKADCQILFGAENGSKVTLCLTNEY